MIGNSTYEIMGNDRDTLRGFGAGGRGSSLWSAFIVRDVKIKNWILMAGKNRNTEYDLIGPHFGYLGKHFFNRCQTS